MTTPLSHPLERGEKKGEREERHGKRLVVDLGRDDLEVGEKGKVIER